MSDGILRSIKAMYREMGESLAPPGSILSCKVCEYTEPLTPELAQRYLQKGWPKHCGQTMRMVERVIDPYPEHTKLSKVQELSQACGAFLAWLEEQGYSICRWSPPIWRQNEDGTLAHDENDYQILERPSGFHPETRPIDEWLAPFFEIDLKKIEDEKRRMLAEQRALNERTASDDSV